MFRTLPAAPIALRSKLIVALLLLANGGAAAQDKPKVEVVGQIGHSQNVRSVAFAPDGRTIITGGVDKSVKLWDVATGWLVRTFAGHNGFVNSVAYSPDGRNLLSGSVDRTISLWDAATGDEVVRFEGHSGAVNSVAFSPDGRSVLSGGGWPDHTVKLWDATTGQVVRTFKGHTDEVTSVAFSPDGRLVLSGSGINDKTIRLWDATTGHLVRTFKGLADGVNSVAFAPDGRRIASGSGDVDGDLKLWDATTGRLVRTLVKDLPTASIAFSSDGAHILAAHGFEIRLWDTKTGQTVSTLKSDNLVSSVAAAPDWRSVLSSGSWRDGTPRLWDVATNRLVRAYEGHSASAGDIALTPDGRTLVSAKSKALELWDTSTGRLIRSSKTAWGWPIAFSPDRRSVLSGSDNSDKTGLPVSMWDTSVRLWDVASGRQVRTFEGPNPKINTMNEVAFSPDGGSVISAGSDKALKLWDAATGALLRSFEGPPNGLTAIAFSPDGRKVASAHNRKPTLVVWDATTGSPLRTFDAPDYISSIAWTPDGGTVLTAGGIPKGGGSDRTIKLWDVGTGALVRTLEVGQTGRRIALAPDGRSVLGSSNNTLKLWDVATGEVLRTFEGHSISVGAVAFSPDGRTAVSASLDGTVRFWSPATGNELVQLLSGPDGGWIALTPEGFFNAKGDIGRFVHLVRGLDVTSIDQVHQSLFNPDLVREALTGDSDGEVEAAANVTNLEKVLDSGPAPTAVISTRADGSQSATDLVEVEARIEDRGKGVGRIEWRVNGITAAVVANLTGSGSVYTITKQLALDPGDNIIEVVAYNGSNLLASLPASTTVKFTGPADKTRPKLHILAIGINSYVDKGGTAPGSKVGGLFEPLDLAVADAKAFAAGVTKAAAGLYDDAPVVTLALDKEATRANLEKIVDKVASQIHPRDTFILFAAGHGYSVQGRFYLIPQDYQGGINPEALATRAIGQDQLQEWLANRIKAKRALILLDTCESGALIAGFARSRTDVPAAEAAVGRLHEATGRPVLTAAALGQFANEGAIGATGETHGYFTWAVLDALRHGDTNGNGLIELSELVAHVQAVVPELAAKKGGTGQAVASEDKQYARFGSRGEDFVVARRLP